ncbi:TolC family protein [Mucilaginibacter sp. HC2]|uniref:TolC family protein n=1 Tax=Mucilaginibacter inviolabilis TaxID=2714892 RepID=UPI001408B59A|nr:TolC family protein [Mucilaginibacter inviolabilis]NHA03365.1 TolC family protein [Mucilaginibacter inviolabilis]
MIKSMLCINRIIAIITSVLTGTIMTLNVFGACAQEPQVLTITTAYRLARESYPLIKQRDLIVRSEAYTISNAAKGYLPALSVNGQATYQSTVTSFPFSVPVPGFSLPKYSRDQYKIYGQIDQVIYDGGLIKNQKQTAEANGAVQQQNLEVELYALYDRVDQLFFGTVLIDEELKQNSLLKQDIQNGIDKANALVANGVAYRSSVDELSAQFLQSEQARIELNAAKKAYLAMLSLLINRPLSEGSVLERPAILFLSDVISRPELLLYEGQKKIDDLQEELLKVQLRPKLGFFAQEGYGRPGLNQLSNNFTWYYIGGFKLTWSLGGLYTLKNQKKLLNLNRETWDVQKEIFLFNTRITQKQQLAGIEKYRELFTKDDAIIALRGSVKKAAGAQLENGVLSAHDYITEVNAENEARQNRILHEIQLLQEQYSYQNTTGNLQEQANQ